MVSIHCPPGYEPGALPLRHSAVDDKSAASKPIYNCADRNSPCTDFDTSFLINHTSHPSSHQQNIPCLQEPLFPRFNIYATNPSPMAKLRNQVSHLPHLDAFLPSIKPTCPVQKDAQR
jgi:hypothetical protein